VDRSVAIGADQEVLPTRDDLPDGPLGEIRRREARNQEVGAGQRPAGQPLPEPSGHRMDRVALGHLLILAVEPVETPCVNRFGAGYVKQEHGSRAARGGERKMIWTILAVIGLIAVLVWLF